MGHAYRSDYEHMIGPRLAAVRQAHETIDLWRPTLRSLWAGRISRIVGGSVGILGAVVTIFTAADTNIAFQTKLFEPTFALVGASIAGIVAYIVSRVALTLIGRHLPLTRGFSQPRLTGGLDLDLAITDAAHPAPALQRRLDRLETASIAVPLVAISLLAPLMIHLAGAAALPGELTASGYSRWIRISGIVVGHAHLTLAVLAYLFARKLHRSNDEDLAAMNVHAEWAKMLGFTVLAAAIPGIFLMFIPPLTVAATGLAFVPLMVIASRRIVTTERAITSVVTTDMSVRLATPDVFEETRRDPVEVVIAAVRV